VSEFRDDDLYGIEGPNTGRIQDKLRDPARLKNWWDQYALEAADRLDWLERELAAVTRERDEARAEVDRLRSMPCPDHAACRDKTVRELTAEVERLREDAERINFIESNPHKVAFARPAQGHRVGSWGWFDTLSNYNESASLREAIDAARKEQA